MTFDPAKHHRRSIRLTGHDYSGGGLYFVTLCAHVGARCISPVRDAPFASPIREIINAEWQRTAELRPYVRLDAYVIMPDHFHALIAIEGGHASLGDVIGDFKAAVSRELRRRGDIHVAQKTEIRIWHRNYYEMIVRTSETADNIRNYIRMNPWKCVQTFGNGLRGMGNPALWNASKMGILCSRKGVRATSLSPIPPVDVYFGGFHSPPEKEILEELLKRHAKIILCPAWGLGQAEAKFLSPLQENRMLLLEMKNRSGDLAAAEERNRFVIQKSDQLWVPHITPNGMLDRLLKESNAPAKF